MANIRYMSAISSADAVMDLPVTNNFSQIVVAVNSSALNSDNYGVSAFKSQNVSPNAVLNSHFADSTLDSTKIKTSAIGHAHLDFRTANSGVQFIQIGGVSSNFPAAGLRSAIVTLTTVFTYGTNSFTFGWANAVYGNPSFSQVPKPIGAPVFVATGAQSLYIANAAVFQTAASTGQIKVHLSSAAIGAATDSATVTVEYAAIGPAST